MASEWFDDVSTEAAATPLSTSAEGQQVLEQVELNRVPTIRRYPVTIAGTRTVGRTLAARTTAWTPAPVTLTYQWYRNGYTVAGKTARTYVLRAADQGKRISVRIYGRKSGYTTTSLLSSQTGKIAKK